MKGTSLRNFLFCSFYLILEVFKVDVTSSSSNSSIRLMQEVKDDPGRANEYIFYNITICFFFTIQHAGFNFLT